MNKQTPKTISEIKQGCGKYFDFEDNQFGILRMKCGKWQRMNTPELFNKIEWCPSCQALLTQTIAMRKSELEFLKYLEKEYNRENDKTDMDNDIQKRIKQIEEEEIIKYLKEDKNGLFVFQILRKMPRKVSS
jgi:thiol-disulfide isomerase/thioredoxin